MTTNLMYDVERILAMFEESGAEVAWKLDALLDLGHHPDPRVTPFLLRVLSDAAEPGEVRVAIIRLLRDRQLASAERLDSARALADVLESSSRDDSGLRVQAALALGDFIDADGALGSLGDTAADAQEEFDVRYAAFTSLERAGPTVRSIDMVNRLRSDETFGRSAQSILIRWRIEQ